MTIGLIGYGKLGSAIAERLRNEGHTLTIYNRSSEKVRGDGLEAVPTPADLASRSSSAILICVTDSAAVQEVLNGAQGLLKKNLDDRLVIDLTTHDYRAVGELHTQVAAAGGRYLEAPVAGSVIPARNGQLVLWASGEKRDYETAEPLLSLLASTRTFVGAAGRATRLKLINNGVLGGFMSVLSEAIDLAERNGFSREEVIELLGQGAGKSTVLTAKQGKLLSGDYGAHFALETLLKDLNLVREMAGDSARAITTLNSATLLYQKAAEIFPGEDFAAVFKLIRN
ncbi:NAD(P)-dependent oxidoreductase [Mangrovitalea sediminis]|uniref:NAD(P)-dependent oxidoreductase n=1 Tax=Mangrovitalea sediminis TaxID=1982043 RepID=UPI000BE621D8|nr:NAD(P)-dependent oxidoreductase [Mangrovitalea sediminis]